MPAYATRAEFEAYVEGWTTTDPNALDRLLERASRDIDGFLAPIFLVTTGTYAGFKVDPTTLATYAAQALSRATCAQAEYRLGVGEADWAQHGHGGTISGPDFSMTTAKNPAGGRPRIGPKAAAELESPALVPLRRLTARARA